MGSEARALELEDWGDEPEVLVNPVVTVPTLLDPTDLEAWKRECKAEMQKEIQVQMRAIGESLRQEIRDQFFLQAKTCVPPPHPQDPPMPPVRRVQRPPDRVSSELQWDEQGRPICLRCGQGGHIRCYCTQRSTATLPLN